MLFSSKTTENGLNPTVASWSWKDRAFQQEARQKKIIIFNFEQLYKNFNYNIIKAIVKP